MSRALDHLRARVVTPALFLAGYVDPPRGPAPSPFAAPRPVLPRQRSCPTQGPIQRIVHKEAAPGAQMWRVKLSCGHSYVRRLSFGGTTRTLRCKTCLENAKRWECLP